MATLMPIYIPQHIAAENRYLALLNYLILEEQLKCPDYRK